MFIDPNPLDDTLRNIQLYSDYNNISQNNMVVFVIFDSAPRVGVGDALGRRARYGMQCLKVFPLLIKGYFITLCIQFLKKKIPIQPIWLTQLDGLSFCKNRLKPYIHIAFYVEKTNVICFNIKSMPTTNKTKPFVFELRSGFKLQRPSKDGTSV